MEDYVSKAKHTVHQAEDSEVVMHWVSSSRHQNCCTLSDNTSPLPWGTAGLPRERRFTYLEQQREIVKIKSEVIYNNNVFKCLLL
jgi:hypothetical protein